MKSIRLSLLVYFLLLLGLALGAFSFLVYENARGRLAEIYKDTDETLTATNEQTRVLLQERYDLTKQTLEVNFDESLYLKAQALGSHSYARWCNHLQPVMISGMLTAFTAPNGHCLLPLWAGEAHYGGLVWPLRRLTGLSVQFVDDPMRAQQHPDEYFQVSNDQGGPVQTSRSLGDYRLGVNPTDLQGMRLYGHRHSDLTLPNGKRLRQVTLRWPIVRFVMGGDRRRPPMSMVIPPDRDFPEKGPSIFIQYASETTEIDAILDKLRTDLKKTEARLREELVETLTDLDHESQRSLTQLLGQLSLLSLATFGICVLGGIWLIHRSLKPMRRLSEAVSKVSEKDVRLHLDQKEVPTELTPIVQRLQLALELLKRAFEREKQAAADISHELRTPISALLATTQVCLRKARAPEEYRATLETCGEIGQQLNILVERLLTLARLDAGVDSMRARPVDVPALAEQCLSLVRPLAEARGLSLRLERDGPVVLHTDPDKLREVVTNLLHNAIQYNRPDGRIDLVVNRQNGHLNLEVRDTGVGIPPHAREHLFERFYRVDPSRQSDTAHAGLGLAIVKGYLELMGGTIEVESTEGQGSTFRVVLPISDEGRRNEE